MEQKLALYQQIQQLTATLEKVQTLDITVLSPAELFSMIGE